jgi:predicted flap endonuclease-1-like 5' DNA nuclease
MNAPAVAKTDPKRRDCACPEEDAPLCELECPTRPRFYCGQLLSDAQLNALIRWTQDRLALVRYRAGWGVVCGLTVRCDPRCHTRVLVEPGYAVSCCGDDLVLCDPLCLDLRKACDDPCDPCAVPEPEDDGEVCEVAGEKVRLRQLRAIDVTIGRGEMPVASEPIGVGCGCNHSWESARDDEEEACAHTSIKEVAAIAWHPVAPSDDPEAAPLDRWVEAYKRCVLVVRRFRANFPDLEQPTYGEEREKEGGEKEYRDKEDPEHLAGRIRKWLLDWLTRTPLHELCFVEERIRGASKEELLNPKWVAEILFFIVQDCRNYHLLCDCQACTEDDVVRLARVWLLAGTDEYGRRACRILYIDPRPPYRRPLGRDCPPVARYRVNAAVLALWRHPEEACVALRSAGIGVRTQCEVELPASPHELWDLLDCPPLLGCGEEVVLQVLDHCLMGRRVVGWCGDKRKPERPYEPRPERPDKPESERPYGQRPERPYEPLPEQPYEPRPERPDEPESERPYGQRPERPYEPRPEQPYEPRPERPDEPDSERPYGQRPERPYEPRPERHYEPSKPDDLSAIDAIGPRRAERCKAHGITTFAALAEVGMDDLRSWLAISEDSARAILEEARQRAGGGEGGAAP